MSSNSSNSSNNNNNTSNNNNSKNKNKNKNKKKQEKHSNINKKNYHNIQSNRDESWWFLDSAFIHSQSDFIWHLTQFRKVK